MMTILYIISLIILCILAILPLVVLIGGIVYYNHKKATYFEPLAETNEKGSAFARWVCNWGNFAVTAFVLIAVLTVDFWGMLYYFFITFILVVLPLFFIRIIGG